MKKRTFFIGDVHGCYDELLSLFDYIGLWDEDHLYFVWDLINKWPKSLEVVEFVRSRPNTWSVIGNHEYFTFSVDEATRRIIEKKHPGWISSLEKKSGNLVGLFEGTDHIKWLTSLPTIIESEDFILVHGGLHPDFWVETPVEIATMIRLYEGKPWYTYYRWSKPIIYGHWAAAWLRVTPNTIGLDTGCCFGGHLTAYCLETKEFWQVRANAVYAEPANWRV